MKTSVQPADQRASDTRGTVKKRMMTWGRPAVPIIRDRVKSTMLMVEPCAAVYSAKPRSVTIWFSLASSGSPSAVSPKRPSAGIGLPVSCSEMNTAGIV